MLEQERIKEAESNVKRYIEEGLLVKSSNEAALGMYLKNSELSMYYIANAVLLKRGYKVGSKISHKVTADALIVYTRNKLRKELLEQYEEVKNDALELISVKVDDLLQSFDFELEKRSYFQYNMSEIIKREKALTSLQRAKNFLYEMKKLCNSN